MSQNKKSEDEKSLKIEGPMTIYEIQEIHKELNQIMENGEVTIDLTDVTDCDTSGIQLLCSAAKTAKEKDIKLSYTGTSEIVEKAAKRIGVEFKTLSGIQGG